VPDTPSAGKRISGKQAVRLIGRVSVNEKIAITAVTAAAYAGRWP
jgi:hypothetical protein